MVLISVFIKTSVWFSKGICLPMKVDIWSLCQFCFGEKKDKKS